jgi:broad specificity phosphatase PhoE
MASKKQRIFLIRHGETEFNRLGVFRGRFEVDLNDRGRTQAAEIGRALKNEGLEILFMSPLGRAVETAQIIGQVIGIGYEIDRAFDNIDLGEWQGVEKTKIQQDYPDLWKVWTTEPERLLIPGGETVAQVKERAFSRLREIVADGRFSSFGIVTHRSVIKTLAASMLDVPAPYFWKFYIDNAAFSIFQHDAAGFALLSWNENAHLSEKVTEVF